MANAIIMQSQISVIEDINHSNLFTALSDFTRNTYMTTIKVPQQRPAVDVTAAKNSIGVFSMYARRISVIYGSNSITNSSSNDLAEASGFLTLCGRPKLSGDYSVHTCALYFDESRNVYDFFTGDFIIQAKYIAFGDGSVWSSIDALFGKLA